MSAPDPDMIGRMRARIEAADTRRRFAMVARIKQQIFADRGETLWDTLTPREREVALLVGEGDTNKGIGRQLGLSPRTVEVHRDRAFKKLQVRNATQLVRLMLNGGLIR